MRRLRSRAATVSTVAVLCLCTHMLVVTATGPCSLRVFQQHTPSSRQALQGGAGHTKRRIWLSLFDAVNATNTECALGKLGQMMTSVLVDETGDECVASPILAAFGRPYYRLKLSTDGDVVQRWQANCDSTCNICEYASDDLDTDICIAKRTSSNPSREFSVAFTSASEGGTCVGPYVTNDKATTTLTAIQSVKFPLPRCLGVNCTAVALVFAFSFGTRDECCHQSSLFGLLDFTYALEMSDNETFTMTWCNGTACDGTTKCASLFSQLPLGVCRDNSWRNMTGRVELVETARLVACKSSHALIPTATLIGIFLGTLVLIAVMVVGIWQFRGRRRRRGYHRVQ